MQDQKIIIDGKSLLETGFISGEVEIMEYPISNRYCYKGKIGKVDKNQIMVGGAWFDFDERWVVRVFNQQSQK